MTRDETIADLQIHGYVPYANQFGWVMIWSDALGKGRMARYFEHGASGPGWDVRDVIAPLASEYFDEVPWHRIGPEELEQLTAKVLPPRFKHPLPDSSMFENFR